MAVRKKLSVAPEDSRGGVSIVITVHNEGNLLAKCVESCRRALDVAAGYFTFSEIILICDNADRRSWELADLLVERRRASSIHRTEFGDPSMARNFGTQQAKGEFLTFIDGDDLINGAYLREFLTRAPRLSGVFLRPRLVLTFGEEKAFLIQYDSKDITNSETMIYSNPWAMPVFGRKEDFLAIPFEADDRDNGFSHEDWEWNLMVLNKGLRFEVAESAIYFARRRRGSRTIAARNFQYVTKPLDFYRNKGNFEGESVTDLGMASKFISGHVGKMDAEDYYSIETSAIRDVRNRIAHSALDHYLRFGRGEGAKARVLEETDHIGKFVANASIESLIMLSDLEGALDPFSYWAQDVPHYDVFISDRNTYVWRQILASGIFDRHWDVVFVLPWIRRGGADLVALKHVEMCMDMGLDVCIITTLKSKNEWPERIPEGVPILALGEIASDVSEIIKLEVFHRLLIELRSKAIHNINSDLFWKVLVRNGLSIRSNTKVVCSLYCQDYNHAGSSVGYDRYIDVCDPYVDHYVTDNTTYADFMTNSLGVNPNKILTIKYPIEVGLVNAAKRVFQLNKRVLWASRLDYQKGFDILTRLAPRASDLEFHFYGEVMLDQFSIHEIQLPKNLVYRGKFAHVEEINPDEFDCFLYTARWDGLPNIVLEMGLKGLPIVSFVTGGLSDVIRPDTAWPSRSATLDGAVEALQEFYKSDDHGISKLSKMRDLLQREHDPQIFARQCEHLYVTKKGNHNPASLVG